jgi:hypothetical protein
VLGPAQLALLITGTRPAVVGPMRAIIHLLLGTLLAMRVGCGKAVVDSRDLLEQLDAVGCCGLDRRPTLLDILGGRTEADVVRLSCQKSGLPGLDLSREVNNTGILFAAALCYEHLLPGDEVVDRGDVGRILRSLDINGCRCPASTPGDDGTSITRCPMSFLRSAFSLTRRLCSAWRLASALLATERKVAWPPLADLDGVLLVALLTWQTPLSRWHRKQVVRPAKLRAGCPSCSLQDRQNQAGFEEASRRGAGLMAQSTERCRGNWSPT